MVAIHTFMFQGAARVTCTSMFSDHSLTLKKWFKVKSDTTKRFAANDFLKVDCTLQTSRTKEDRGTFMLTPHSLTLKERPKVKSDITKRFAAYDFQKVDCNNK